MPLVQNIFRKSNVLHSPKVLHSLYVFHHNINLRLAPFTFEHAMQSNSLLSRRFVLAERSSRDEGALPSRLHGVRLPGLPHALLAATVRARERRRRKCEFSSSQSKNALVGKYFYAFCWHFRSGFRTSSACASWTASGSRLQRVFWPQMLCTNRWTWARLRLVWSARTALSLTRPRDARQLGAAGKLPAICSTSSSSLSLVLV